MRKEIILSILCIALVSLLASAGCISDFGNTAHSLNPVASFGELRGMYLNYVDENSGESWWADMKTKVGSSVLSLKGPNISVSEVELTDEKRQILEAALKVYDSSMYRKTGVNIGKYVLFNQSGSPDMIMYDYFIPVSLNNTPEYLQFWTEYSGSHLPFFNTGAVSAVEWRKYWPQLRDALLNAAENISG